MLKITFKKSYLVFLLLLVQLLSAITPAAFAMQTARNVIQDSDYAPICNGTGKIHWIKLSEYYRTGKITFVELPTTNDSNKSDNSNSCPICSLFTHLDDKIAFFTISLFFEKAEAAVNLPPNSPYFKQKITSANSRAPPVFS